jgi:hypothetical protein
MDSLIDLPPELLWIIGQKADKYTQPFLALTCRIFYLVLERTKKHKHKDAFLSSMSRYQLSIENKIEWESETIVLYAINVGNMDVFLELTRKYECNQDMFNYALQCGELEMVKYLDQKLDHIELKGERLFLVKSVGVPECPINFAVLKSPECLDYIVQKGYYEKINERLPVRCYVIAAEIGNLEMVKHLIERYDGKKVKPMIAKAIQKGQVEVFKYLHSVGFFINSNSYKWATRYGGEKGFEIVKYLYQNGCSMNYDNYLVAVDSGEQEILDFLVEKGCPTTYEGPDLYMSRDVPYFYYQLSDDVSDEYRESIRDELIER